MRFDAELPPSELPATAPPLFDLLQCLLPGRGLAGGVSAFRA